ncbi:MAG: hypothetical protein IIC50_11080 [Planctomycetes bacterium]|nr:hypothetical protein [Planctomycetota bacterium]
MSTKVLAEQRSPRQHLSSQRWRKPLGWIGLVVVVTSAPAWILGLGSSRENGPKKTYTVARGDLWVTVTEKGVLESADNTEIKCQVRGASTVIWAIESGSYVTPGDELVRLETLAIEEAISERTKYSHWSRSAAERSAADVARAELATSEYLEGRYRTELMTLEKNLTLAQSDQLTAQNILAHSETMARRGYVSDLDVQEGTHWRTRAALNVDLTKKRIEVLERYTKAMELETLKGNLNEARARHAANVERAKMDEARRVLAVEELGYCVIKAERTGLVIYPSLAAWKKAPEIEEGATVHRDQILLIMPDLSKMQVEIGIHESIIDRIRPGLAARITLPDKTLDGEVTSVAAVTNPAGWWTGNAVKYDTVIKLPPVPGLRPGMSAEVEVIVQRHENVLIIPVGVVLQTVQGDFCWIKTAAGVNQRRPLQLGDTNDEFIVVNVGLEEGDEVLLDPLATVAEAQRLALMPSHRAGSGAAANQEADHVD